MDELRNKAKSYQRLLRVSAAGRWRESQRSYPRLGSPYKRVTGRLLAVGQYSQVNKALGLKFWRDQGLVSLAERYLELRSAL